MTPSPIPTFVDGADGELVQVCAACLEENAECSTCPYRDEDYRDQDFEEEERRG